MKYKLVPPTSYQGGKQRISAQIIDHINPSKDDLFFDFCCGCGAVSIELINRGFLPERIHMLDKGPWGLFWKAIGEGSFDLNRFSTIVSCIPKERSEIKGYMEQLSKRSSDIDTVYIFLLLQASSFGSKSIWINDGKWQNCSFRSYWMPTETSNRRSPVNPMMPMPETLFDRVEMICRKMLGVKGLCSDISEQRPNKGIVYIDPPYKGTTMYGHKFDVLEYVESLSVECYVSEGVPLSEESVILASGRSKGGISGYRKTKANEEWLSKFN